MESAKALSSPSIALNGVLLSSETQYFGRTRIRKNVQPDTKIKVLMKKKSSKQITENGQRIIDGLGLIRLFF